MKHLPLAGFLSAFLLSMFGLGKQVGSAPELFPVKINHFLSCIFLTKISIIIKRNQGTPSKFKTYTYAKFIVH
jgi:hypothetical protein